jgi:glycosyltransferase involved in cell wall biosynthesis
MKILHIIESLGRGGAEQALVNLLPALRVRGIECEVAALWPPYVLASELEQKGIQVHRLDIARRRSVIKGTLKVSKCLRQGQFDIAHAHLFFSNLYMTLSCPLVPSARRIVTFHNLGYASYPANTLWRTFRKQIQGILTRYCTHSQIAVSTAVAQHYSAHLKLLNIQVIPNAFPTNELHPDSELNHTKIRARYDIGPNELVIVVPGRLVPEKNHAMLLQALGILKQKNLRPRVLIFGDGPLQASLNKMLITEALEGQVVLHRTIPHSELMQIVQAADMFIIASKFEGFGLAPAEAMALAKPVIATRVGGLTDLIEDGVSGLLVPPEDAASLADGIAQLMAKPALRERLGQAGRKRIETCFSVDVIADRYVRYYETLLTNNKN